MNIWAKFSSLKHSVHFNLHVVSGICFLEVTDLPETVVYALPVCRQSFLSFEPFREYFFIGACHSISSLEFSSWLPSWTTRFSVLWLFSSSARFFCPLIFVLFWPPLLSSTAIFSASCLFSKRPEIIKKCLMYIRSQSQKTVRLIIQYVWWYNLVYWHLSFTAIIAIYCSPKPIHVNSCLFFHSC